MLIPALMAQRGRRSAPPIGAGALNVALKLTSTLGGTNLPFAVGHVFKQGDVPSGASIVASGTSGFQASIRTTWPDGSARFALLAGRADFTASVQKTLTLTAGSAAGGTNLTTSDLQATSATASIGYGAFGTASFSGSDWASPFQTISSGPQMSSWTYRKQIGSDAHLVAWLEVRLYAGGAVEVLPWIENGYLNVASPTSKSATATFTLGGTQRVSVALDILHHTRAVLASGTTLTHWLGTDPAITPQHDAAYMMASKMVPNYGVVAVGSGSAVYSRMSTSYTPFDQGAYPTSMGAVGYDLTIGLLPEWEAAFYAGGADPRAFKAIVISGYLAARYALHYRDETTNLAPLHASYPNLCINLNNPGISAVGGSTTGTYTPEPTGSSPPNFSSSHHPALCYSAYLLTGWHWFCEEMQFLANALWMKQVNTNRQTVKSIIETSAGANQTRGAAWAIRSIALAAAATPDSHALKAQLTAAVSDNIDYYHGRYVAISNNPLGIVQPYDIIDSGYFASAAWQDDFFTAVFGWIKDLNVHSSSVQSKLDVFLAWKYVSVVGRLGAGTAGTFNYRYGAQFLHATAPSTSANYDTGAGPWYADWGASATAMSIPAADGGTSLQGTSGADPAFMNTGYWGNLHPALAYAVDHGATGASAAYARLIGASNYSSSAAGFASDPVWSVKPRT